MSDSMFFGKEKGQERKIVMRSATLLVGKAPSKHKRIKIPIRLPLSGQKLTGVPAWIANAYTFVAQNHESVVSDLKLRGFQIQFGDNNLFEKGASATKATMMGFVIAESGESENPDVDLTFVVWAPFSTALWKWCGQYGGEDQFARFEHVETEEDFTLTGDNAGEEAEQEETIN